jgi:hypothetical protein
MEKNERGKPSDDRSPTSKGMDLVTRVISGSLVFIIPIVGGFYLDGRMGTGLLWTLVGLGFGMAAGSWQLYRLIQSSEDTSGE